MTSKHRNRLFVVEVKNVDSQICYIENNREKKQFVDIETETDSIRMRRPDCMLLKIVIYFRYIITILSYYFLCNLPQGDRSEEEGCA